MTDAHANASSSLIISDSSSSVYYDDNYLDLDQYLSCNVGKKRFSWNGTVEDLETFIDARLIRSVDKRHLLIANGEASVSLTLYF